MDKVVYTIGYGNMKPAELIAKLKEHGINHVYDVRREGSGAWCKEYRHGIYISSFFAKNGIAYNELSYLGNHSGELEAYRTWLASAGGRKAILRATAVQDAAWKVFAKTRHHNEEVPCLLCCEIDHTRCHRTLIAEAMAKEAKKFGVVVQICHL